MSRTALRPGPVARFLALLAVAWSAGLPQARALPTPPLMEGVRAVALAQSLRINGVPTSVRVFTTNKSLAELLSFYRKRFGEGRVETAFQGWTVITRREDDFLYTARLRRALQGTEGTVSVADLREGLSNLGHPLGIALPAGSKLAVDVEMTDPGKRARVLTITNGGSVDANAEFFKTELESRGYRMDRDLPGATGGVRGRSIWFSAPNRAAILVVSAVATGASVVLNMTESTETER